MNAYVPKGVRTRKAWKFIVVWLVGQQKRSFEKLRGVLTKCWLIKKKKLSNYYIDI